MHKNFLLHIFYVLMILNILNYSHGWVVFLIYIGSWINFSIMLSEILIFSTTTIKIEIISISHRVNLQRKRLIQHIIVFNERISFTITVISYRNNAHSQIWDISHSFSFHLQSTKTLCCINFSFFKPIIQYWLNTNRWHFIFKRMM